MNCASDSVHDPRAAAAIASARAMSPTRPGPSSPDARISRQRWSSARASSALSYFPLPDSLDPGRGAKIMSGVRSEEHTSELQSQFHLVCRLLLEKKKK